MLDFTQLESELNDLSARDKCSLILSKIYEYNHVTDLRDITVLTGTILNDLEDGYYLVGGLKSVLYDSLSINPYTDDPLAIHVAYSFDGSQAAVGEQIAFNVVNNLSITSQDLLCGTNLFTFQKLSLSPDASVEERIEKIKQIKPFANRLKQIETFLHERNKSTTQDISSHSKSNDSSDNNIGEKEHADTPVLKDEPSKEKELSPGAFDSIHIDEFCRRLDYNYNLNSVRSFLIALGTNQIITLFGAPGTGKTTFVRKMAKALGAHCNIISVQNNWTDSSDLLGFYSPINRTYESTTFLEAILQAKKDWQEKSNASPLHIICLDEMNLARVEYYFAYFLSLLQLDPEEQIIHLLPKYLESELDAFSSVQDIPLDKNYLKQLWDYSSFQLPGNIRFVGTMNNDDTTTFLSPKVIDRSFFIEITNSDFSEYTLKQPEGYFPCQLFEAKHISFTHGKEYFEGENSRFKNYAAQMAEIYNCLISSRGSADEYYHDFYEDLIIGKILPALRTAVFNYNSELFPRAFEAYTRHQTIGNFYNYLGGF